MSRIFTRAFKLSGQHLTLAVATGVIISSGAFAGDASQSRWREVWSGVDVTSNSWLIYSGVTLAPFSHIHGDGIRVRMTSGYGEYSYSAVRRIGFNPEPILSELSYDARTGFLDALIGYQSRIGALTAKAFVGASAIGHFIAPFDPENSARDLKWGLKGAIELWLNAGEIAWASFDASWSTAHDTRSARARIGYRILPTVSLGPEARFDFNIEDDLDREAHGDGALEDNARGGMFLRYEWDGGEISAAAGVTGNFEDELNPYGTLNWITQF